MKSISVAILTLLMGCCFAQNASAQTLSDSANASWASWRPYQTDTTSKQAKRAKARKLVAKKGKDSASVRPSGFLSTDRYFEKYHSWSPYVYAVDNPLRYSDPSGDTIVFAGVDPKKIEAQFNTAVNYLRAGGVDMMQIDALRSSTAIITVQSITDNNIYYESGARIVYWNPNSALTTPDGKGLSPAMILLHELGGHAYQDVFHPTRYARDTDKDGAGFDKQYDTKEERRVIEQIEQPAAQILGEGLRYDHISRPFIQAPSPTSFLPAIPNPNPPENQSQGKHP